MVMTLEMKLESSSLAAIFNVGQTAIQFFLVTAQYKFYKKSESAQDYKMSDKMSYTDTYEIPT